MNREDTEERLWRFERAADHGVPEEQTIVRVTYFEDGRSRIPMAAVNYNRSQDKYRVVCEEAGDDLDQLIVSGKGGDLMMTADSDMLYKYAEKGLFADLDTLLPDLFSNGNLLGCARAAGEIGGKLLGVPAEFDLTALAARRSLVGDAEWTPEAFLALNASLSEEQQLFPRMSQTEFYLALRDGILSECIDSDAGSCSFEESSAFETFLEQLAALPSSSPTDDYGKNTFITGQTALFEADLSSISGYAQAVSGAIFGDGEEVRLVGYPAAGGGVAKMRPNAFFSILQDSAVREGAADFLRYLLSPEAAVDTMRGMRSVPALKSTLEAYRESETMLNYFFYYDDYSHYNAELRNGEPSSSDVLVAVPVTDALFDDYVRYLDNVRIFPRIPETIRSFCGRISAPFLRAPKAPPKPPGCFRTASEPISASRTDGRGRRHASKTVQSCDLRCNAATSLLPGLTDTPALCYNFCQDQTFCEETAYVYLSSLLSTRNLGRAGARRTDQRKRRHPLLPVHRHRGASEIQPSGRQGRRAVRAAAGTQNAVLHRPATGRRLYRGLSL